jgi:hypothetical protein
MISSHVLKIHIYLTYLVAIECLLTDLLMVLGMYPIRYIVMKVVVGLGKMEGGITR